MKKIFKVSSIKDILFYKKLKESVFFYKKKFIYYKIFELIDPKKKAEKYKHKRFLITIIN